MFLEDLGATLQVTLVEVVLEDASRARQAGAVYEGALVFTDASGRGAIFLDLGETLMLASRDFSLYSFFRGGGGSTGAFNS